MKSLARWVALVIGAAGGTVAFASGPMDYAARFWDPDHPGPTVEEMVAGQLGVLDLGQDPEILLVAYRQLAGLDADAATRRVLAESFRAPPLEESLESRQQRWLTERKRVPGAEPLHWIATERQVRRREGNYERTDYLPNCLADAFATAASTLAARIAEHGAESAEVHQWLFAQDQVFKLCQEGDEPPPPLDATWPEWLRRDREYQIAAAHFYAQHFEEALRRFEEIGRDSGSPWRTVARYLVARTALKAGDAARAKDEVHAILADASLAAVHPATRRLEGLLLLRAEPEARRDVLRQRLLAPSLAGVDPAELRQNRIDFFWLGSGGGGSDFGAWLAAMAPLAPEGDPAKPEPPVDPPAYSVWHKSKSPAWLVAALAVSQGGEKDLGALLEAGARLPATSPAAVTVGFHRARLLARREGEVAEARRILDGLLTRPGLPLAAGNRIRHLRASLAVSLEDYLAFSLQEPSEVGFSDGSHLWPDSSLPSPGKLLTDEAVAHLNLTVSVAELAGVAARADLLPANWRQRLGLAAWVRALLAGDGALAEAVVPILEPLVPAGLAAELAAWRAAPAGPERDFAAWLILLRYPGLSPWIEEDVGRRTPLDEMDSLRLNGWCVESGEGPTYALEPVRFRPGAERGMEVARPALEASPIYLGQRVMAYAEAHPEDPRVPEALHRVVRFTRYGCAWGDEVGVVSKRAFDRLHRRYPKSEWTAKTPYWFSG